MRYCCPCWRVACVLDAGGGAPSFPSLDNTAIVITRLDNFLILRVVWFACYESWFDIRLVRLICLAFLALIDCRCWCCCRRCYDLWGIISPTCPVVYSIPLPCCKRADLLIEFSDNRSPMLLSSSSSSSSAQVSQPFGPSNICTILLS